MLIVVSNDQSKVGTTCIKNAINNAAKERLQNFLNKITGNTGRSYLPSISLTAVLLFF
jgi:hypothetical protein